MNLRIVPVSDQHQDWIRGYLQEHWGTPQIVSRGIVHQTDQLPGFIALLEDKPVGLVTYHIEGSACEVVSLDSDMEGQGIGTALLHAVGEQAKAQDCTRLWLITTNDNTDALRFYQKRGFELAAIYHHAVEQARLIKPMIPLIGLHGIPIRDEIELELTIPQLIQSHALPSPAKSGQSVS